MTPLEVASGTLLEAKRRLLEVRQHPRWAEAVQRRPMLLARLDAAGLAVGALSADFASARLPPPDGLERATCVLEALERLLAEVERGGEG